MEVDWELYLSRRLLYLRLISPRIISLSPLLVGGSPALTDVDCYAPSLHFIVGEALLGGCDAFLQHLAHTDIIRADFCIRCWFLLEKAWKIEYERYACQGNVSSRAERE